MQQDVVAWIGIGLVLMAHLIAIVAIGVRMSGKVDALREAQVATTRAIESGAETATGILDSIAKQDTRLALLEQRMSTTESDIREVKLTAREAATVRREDRKREERD
jgi:hypothetical protein